MVLESLLLLTHILVLVSPGCGAYGYDINQLCAAWTEAPEEMTREQYQVRKKQKGLVLRICVILGMEEDPRNGNEFEEK